MANKVRIGFIGAGFVGQLGHIQLYKELEYVEMAVLCEARENLRVKAGNYYDFKKTVSHVDQIEASDCDGVVVVTRRQHVGPVVETLLRKGIPVLTEKPMCHTLEQAEALVSLAKEHKTQLFVGYTRRSDKAFGKSIEYIKKICKENKFGKLLRIEFFSRCGNSYQGQKPAVSIPEKYIKDIPSWNIAPSYVPEKQKMDYERFLNIYCHQVNELNCLIEQIPTLGELKIQYVNLSDIKNPSVFFLSDDVPVEFNFCELDHPDWFEWIDFTFDSAILRLVVPAAFKKDKAISLNEYNEGKWETRIEGKEWAFKSQAKNFASFLSLRKEKLLVLGRDATEDLRLVERIWKKYLET